LYGDGKAEKDKQKTRAGRLGFIVAFAKLPAGNR
jgi:hypothetical protein